MSNARPNKRFTAHRFALVEAGPCGDFIAIQLLKNFWNAHARNTPCGFRDHVGSTRSAPESLRTARDLVHASGQRALAFRI